MREPTYEHDKVEAASLAAISEVFGAGTRTAEALTANIMSKLVLGTTVEQPEPTPEALLEKDGPDYTRRALTASSAKELYEILAEAAKRLSLSIAHYNDKSSYHESSGILLTPWVFAEGAGEGEGPLLGNLMLQVPEISSEPPERQTSPAELIAFIQLRGGESSPFDFLEEGVSRSDPHVEHSIMFYREWVEDPLSGTKFPLVYLHREQEFCGYGPKADGVIYSDNPRKGAPNPYRQASLITAEIFWALDSAIRYYEDVYIGYTKAVGLTYADYRDAGCLGEDGKVDREKAEAHIQSMRENSLVPVEEDRFPLLRDPEVTALTIPEHHREFYEKHREHVRIGQQALLGTSL